jgi:hypothetical protein
MDDLNTDADWHNPIVLGYCTFSLYNNVYKNNTMLFQYNQIRVALHGHLSENGRTCSVIVRTHMLLLMLFMRVDGKGSAAHLSNCYSCRLLIMSHDAVL